MAYVDLLELLDHPAALVSGGVGIISTILACAEPPLRRATTSETHASLALDAAAGQLSS